MRQTQTPPLSALALLLLLGGSVTAVDAQSAPCPAEAWLRVGWYTSVQEGPPRRASALWSRADPVALFAALGGGTSIGSRTPLGERPDAAGASDSDEFTSTIVRTNRALVVQFQDMSNSFDGTGRGTVAQLRAMPERCMSVSSRVTSAGPAAPVVDSNAPTR